MGLDVSAVLTAMMEYFGNDVARINHAMKVHTFARTIGGMEGLDPEQIQVLEAAAVLHDIGIKISEEKYNSSAGHYQELEGPAIAKELLLPMNPDPGVLERVCFLIGHHHTYSAIDDIVFRILVEADFLVNAYEDGMKPDAIESLGTKIFKTRTGSRLLSLLYKAQD